MQFLSVPEAARELQVNPSRVRALVASGELSGRKLGGRWIVESVDVSRRKQSPRPAGRPLEPQNAWGALFLASGLAAPWLESVARWRLRQSLAASGLKGLMPRLIRRSELHRFFVHPGELRYLGERPDLVRAGVSAATAHELDPVPGHELDAYVRDKALERLRSDHALSPASAGQGNVVLRAIPDFAWHFQKGSVAPLAAVAIDLAEEPDSRSARIGAEAIKRLDRKLRRSQ